MDNRDQLKEVYHKQPLQYHTTGEQSPLVLHMQYLDSLTPYELLKMINKVEKNRFSMI